MKNKELKWIAGIYNRMEQEGRSKDELKGFSGGLDVCLSFSDMDVVKAEYDKLKAKRK